MIEVDPLGWHGLLASVRDLPINTLFVQSILCRHVDGRIFADARDPRALYALHPYGMALLWGRSDREDWLAWLRDHLRATERPAPEWLQVYPAHWADIVEPVVGAAHRYTRVNFAFDRACYLRERARVARAIDEAAIVPTTAAMFSAIDGSVVPQRFWRDATQFLRAGGGFSMRASGELVATAFCSYRHGTQLEIGIETAERHRGNGYARLVACALIDDCLRRGLEPVWACRLENVGSYRLARALGFMPTAHLPYYRLPDAGPG